MHFDAQKGDFLQSKGVFIKILRGSAPNPHFHAHLSPSPHSKIRSGVLARCELWPHTGAQLGILEGRGPGDKKGTIRNFV